MKGEGLAARAAAWQALRAWQEGRGWVLDLLNTACADLDPRDRGLAYEIALGTCRWHGRLGAALATWCPKAPKVAVGWLLELSLYQLFGMDRVPAHAVLDLAVQLAREARLGEPTAKFVNAVLRRAQRDGLPPLPTEDIPRLSQLYGAPPWLLRRWLRHASLEEVEQRLKPVLQAPAQFIRVHQGRTDRETLMKALPESKPVGERYLLVAHSGRLAVNPLFTAGHFSFQNPSAELVARLLDVRPGDRVWDACAAPGGKTAMLAEACPAATFVASDVNASRLQSVDDLRKRLGLLVHTCVADAAKPPFAGVFDRVLLDVPCSNLGVMGRRPEVLYRLEQKSLDALPALQLRLLKAAAHTVRPGGVMVYATCSPEPEETFAVVERFLRSEPGFVLEDASPYADEAYIEKHCIRVPANEQGLDLFFAARFRRLELTL